MSEADEENTFKNATAENEEAANNMCNDKGVNTCCSCKPLELLNFIECLSSTTNSIEMQILINKYDESF